jgi:hypothetical protein
MQHFVTSGRRAAALCCLALIAAVTPAVSGSNRALAKTGDQAGVAAVVRGEVNQVSYRTPKAAVGRVVASGDKIRLGDRIITGGKAGLQIMLLDKTVFTIGPNASMVIDQFIYNPESGKGKVTARILKGSFRFVSGRIAKTTGNGMTIKLPTATIGVRGTTGGGFTDGTRSFIILLGMGPNNSVGRPASRIIVTAGGVTRIIYRSGFGVIILGPGLPPSRVRRLAALYAAWHLRLFRPFGGRRGPSLPGGGSWQVLKLSGQALVDALTPIFGLEQAQTLAEQINHAIIIRRQTFTDPPGYVPLLFQECDGPCG